MFHIECVPVLRMWDTLLNEVADEYRVRRRRARLLPTLPCLRVCGCCNRHTFCNFLQIFVAAYSPRMVRLPSKSFRKGYPMRGSEALALTIIVLFAVVALLGASMLLWQRLVVAYGLPRFPELFRDWVKGRSTEQASDLKAVLKQLRRSFAPAVC